MHSACPITHTDYKRRVRSTVGSVSRAQPAQHNAIHNKDTRSLLHIQRIARHSALHITVIQQYAGPLTPTLACQYHFEAIAPPYTGQRMVEPPLLAIWQWPAPKE